MGMKLASIALLGLTLAATLAHGAPSKGTLVSGPVVQPGKAVMFSDIELRADEATAFSVDGRGGNVDCAVFNAKGAVVAEDNRPVSSCRIKFTPPSEGKYTFMVTNVGDHESATTVIIQ